MSAVLKPTFLGLYFLKREQQFFNTGIVVCDVIPQMGGWTFMTGWFIKPSYMAQNEL